MMNCPNCGTPIAEGNAFCTSCGLRLGSPANSFKDIFEQIKQYDVVVDKSTIPWLKFRDLGESGSFNAAIKLDNMITELNEKIGEALALPNLGEEERITLHVYVLDRCRAMLDATTSALEDCGDMLGLFKYMTNQPHIENNFDINRVNSLVNDIDKIYRKFWGFNFVFAMRLKSALEEPFIRNHVRLQEKTIAVANSFNNAFNAYVSRIGAFIVWKEAQGFESYKMGLTRKEIDAHWKLYVEILRGLTARQLSRIDDSSWEKAAENAAQYLENTNQSDEAASVRNHVSTMRLELRKQMEQEERERLFADNPELKARYAEAENRVAALTRQAEQCISKVNKSRLRQAEIRQEIASLHNKVDSNNQEIARLERKLFGKAKAAAQASELKSENEGFIKEISDLESQHERYGRTAADAETKLNQLNNELEAAKSDLAGVGF